ncbi:MAG: DEAD/DEAH box helicase family protein, partial [Clostridia bacterium]|nr:DEAD/DEAH box helicase family protein [Clostridia bacterium]
MITQRFLNSKKPRFNDGILKEHNKVVYERIFNAYKNGKNRVWIQHASGAGKSYIAAKVIKSLSDNTFEKIARLGRRRLLGDYSTREQKRVLFITSRNNLSAGFDELIDELGKDFRKLDRKVELVPSNYHSLQKHLEEEYDMIIFDEMHHLGAETWGPLAEQIVQNSPTAKVLGLTATPNRPDGKDITKIFDGDGPVSELPFDEAIVESILPAPFYVLGQYMFEEEKRFLEEDRQDLKFRLETATGEERRQLQNLIKQLEEAQAQIEKAKNLPQIFADVFSTEKLRNGKYIVFCPKEMGKENSDTESAESLKTMEYFIEQAKETWFKDLPEVAQPKIYKVHSKYKDSDNIQQLRDFENDKSSGIKLMFSVDMLGEGNHIDDIDGVIMLRPTGSEIVFIQQLARALSVGNNPHPLILDLVGNLTYSNYEITQKLITEINERKKEYERTHKPKFNTPNFELKTINLSTVEFVERIRNNILAYELEIPFEEIK